MRDPHGYWLIVYAAIAAVVLGAAGAVVILIAGAL